ASGASDMGGYAARVAARESGDERVKSLPVLISTSHEQEQEHEQEQDGTCIDMNNGEVVRLIDVEKTYRTGEMEVRAVRGVSLEMQRGEFVAVMGERRSGK